MSPGDVCAEFLDNICFNVVGNIMLDNNNNDDDDDNNYDNKFVRYYFAGLVDRRTPN